MFGAMLLKSIQAERQTTANKDHLTDLSKFGHFLRNHWDMENTRNLQQNWNR